MGKLLSFFSKPKATSISALIRMQVNYTLEIEELNKKINILDFEIQKLIKENDRLRNQLNEKK